MRRNSLAPLQIYGYYESRRARREKRRQWAMSYGLAILSSIILCEGVVLAYWVTR
jgi:hypothetical protein